MDQIIINKMLHDAYEAADLEQEYELGLEWHW